MDASQAIIVKKIKKGGHGHHGGAWKVAFADFVTAMMAFFLLLWLMGSTTPQEKAAISDFFNNPSAVQGPGGASTSMVKLGAVDEQVKKSSKSAEDSNDTKSTSSSETERPVEAVRDAQHEKVRLDSLKQDLEKAISASAELNKFKDQLLLDITPEGLRIQIIDKENRPMFSSGRSDLKPYTKTILHEIAKIIGKVPNKISLTGHTDATPFRSMRGYTNWELSADRANSSRRALVRGGLNEAKVAKVVGLSSTILFDKKNPTNPVNRRISLIVMNKQAEEALLKDVKVNSLGQASSSVAPAIKRANGRNGSSKPTSIGAAGSPGAFKLHSPIKLGPKPISLKTLSKPGGSRTSASKPSSHPRNTLSRDEQIRRRLSREPAIKLRPIELRQLGGKSKNTKSGSGPITLPPPTK